ncbi:MAG: phosphatidylglycerophosphatase A [Ginsengibacter sp.]
MILNKAIATVCGIGFLPKGGGSVAAAVYCIIWFLWPTMPLVVEIFSTLIVVVIGIYCADKVEILWGKDSSKVVIDEVAGMMIALLFVPFKWQYLVFAFVAFRFFDIVKPLGIRNLEKLPGGWGVMADDVLSGIYAWILLMGCIWFKIF